MGIDPKLGKEMGIDPKLGKEVEKSTALTRAKLGKSHLRCANSSLLGGYVLGATWAEV